ncbi:TPA: hypothetical protein DEP21_01905 [Patescibacteria group bacterium]|nr:hypothetical protein [Candidatus Gracilibacteria bacterium]
MLVWHDIAETRIGDMHKVAIRYIRNKDELEKEVMEEQFEGLSFADQIKLNMAEMDERSTLE